MQKRKEILQTYFISLQRWQYQEMTYYDIFIIVKIVRKNVDLAGSETPCISDKIRCLWYSFPCKRYLFWCTLEICIRILHFGKKPYENCILQKSVVKKKKKAYTREIKSMAIMNLKSLFWNYCRFWQIVKKKKCKFC